MNMEDFKPRIIGIVRKFRRRFGGDYEETLAKAYLLFTQALRSHDVSKGTFEKRFVFVIWNGLLDDYRRQKSLKRGGHLKKKDMVWESIPEKNRFDLVRFLSGISDEAAEVVRVALGEAPAEVARTLYSPFADLEVFAYFYRKGWDGGRISRAFEEIREALS